MAEALQVRRQTVNQVCRRLSDKGRLHRAPGPNGRIVNRLLPQHDAYPKSVPAQPDDASAPAQPDDQARPGSQESEPAASGSGPDERPDAGPVALTEPAPPWDEEPEDAEPEDEEGVAARTPVSVSDGATPAEEASPVEAAEPATAVTAPVAEEPASADTRPAVEEATADGTATVTPVAQVAEVVEADQVVEDAGVSAEAPEPVAATPPVAADDQEPSEAVPASVPETTGGKDADADASGSRAPAAAAPAAAAPGGTASGGTASGGAASGGEAPGDVTPGDAVPDADAVPVAAAARDAPEPAEGGPDETAGERDTQVPQPVPSASRRRWWRRFL
ncbi:hypothetical protein BL254_14330 [Protofrankia sp. BMG5.30]|uniref:MarR family protein n=1 Tax=Protofrankia coriariae TaxID=1562887 RepID=A0ABR5F337_9ACTN|nr:hypothetical protein FrCorBMG51_13480 [Protofrankia coriariae]ONH34785.1 hypothetical protein BL254_14330 [Protofrankia sp. BMG5.30]